MSDWRREQMGDRQPSAQMSLALMTWQPFVFSLQLGGNFIGFAAKGGGKGMDFEIKQPYSATCQPCP